MNGLILSPIIVGTFSEVYYPQQLTVRWDPNRENMTFFKQSVLLYTSYHHLGIIVHRAFIHSRNKPSPLSYSCLVMCTNAARSCARIAEAYYKRCGKAIPFIHVLAVLLLFAIQYHSKQNDQFDAFEMWKESSFGRFRFYWWTIMQHNQIYMIHEKVFYIGHGMINDCCCSDKY